MIESVINWMFALAVGIDLAAVIMIVVCVVIVVLPPRYDPAIRLKERQLKRAARRIELPAERLNALQQAANEQPMASYPYCERGWLDCGSQTCGCMDTPHYRARWQVARADRIMEMDK